MRSAWELQSVAACAPEYDVRLEDAPEDIDGDGDVDEWEEQLASSGTGGALVRWVRCGAGGIPQVIDGHPTNVTRKTEWAYEADLDDVIQANLSLGLDLDLVAGLPPQINPRLLYFSRHLSSWAEERVRVSPTFEMGWLRKWWAESPRDAPGKHATPNPAECCEAGNAGSSSTSRSPASSGRLAEGDGVEAAAHNLVEQRVLTAVAPTAGGAAAYAACEAMATGFGSPRWRRGLGADGAAGYVAVLTRYDPNKMTYCEGYRTEGTLSRYMDLRWKMRAVDIGHERKNYVVEPFYDAASTKVAEPARAGTRRYVGPKFASMVASKTMQGSTLAACRELVVDRLEELFTGFAPQSGTGVGEPTCMLLADEGSFWESPPINPLLLPEAELRLMQGEGKDPSKGPHVAWAVKVVLDLGALRDVEAINIFWGNAQILPMPLDWELAVAATADGYGRTRMRTGRSRRCRRSSSAPRACSKCTR